MSGGTYKINTRGGGAIAVILLSNTQTDHSIFLIFLVEEGRKDYSGPTGTPQGKVVAGSEREKLAKISIVFSANRHADQCIV